MCTFASASVYWATVAVVFAMTTSNCRRSGLVGRGSPPCNAPRPTWTYDEGGGTGDEVTVRVSREATEAEDEGVGGAEGSGVGASDADAVGGNDGDVEFEGITASVVVDAVREPLELAVAEGDADADTLAEPEADRLSASEPGAAQAPPGWRRAQRLPITTEKSGDDGVAGGATLTCAGGEDEDCDTRQTTRRAANAQHT